MYHSSQFLDVIHHGLVHSPYKNETMQFPTVNKDDGSDNLFVNGLFFFFQETRLADFLQQSRVTTCRSMVKVY